MTASLKQDLSGPATLEAVLKAVVKLSTLDEADFTALASSDKLRDVFPFRPSAPTEPIADFATDDALVDASPLPLSVKQRAMLIQSSMPQSQTSAPVFNREPLAEGMSESFEVLVREIQSLNI